MFGDMLSKLGDMKAAMSQQKERLETVRVKGSSPEDKVVVILDGNRKVKDIKIDPEVMEDAEYLEDYLSLAFNRAIENADKVNEAEMGDMAKQFLP